MSLYLILYLFKLNIELKQILELKTIVYSRVAIMIS